MKKTLRLNPYSNGRYSMSDGYTYENTGYIKS